MSKSNSSHLPFSYFGVIGFYAAFYTLNKTSFSVDERFIKQTYRTRTPIIGANGLINLTVPVIKTKGSRSFMSDINVSYAQNWPKEHLKSIESAYRNTPYFIYYYDDLTTILNQEYKTLIDLNRATISFCLAKLGLDVDISDKTTKSQTQLNYEVIINPKRAKEIKIPRYIQCFEERHGFIGNLSILDLIFNEGPNAISILGEVAQLNPQLTNF